MYFELGLPVQQLFIHWITIQWIAVLSTGQAYPLDNVIRSLNNRGLVLIDSTFLANPLFSLRDINLTLGLLPPRRHVI